MTDLQRQWLRRIVAGGLAGAALTAAAVYVLNGLFYYDGVFRPALVSAGMLRCFGSWPLALGAGLAAAFALGAAVGVATLPFDQYGPALAVRSLLHFAVTGALALLLGWVLWQVDGAAALLLFGLYAFLYLVVWLARWCTWRAELSELRAALDLPEPAATPLRWRESLPYLLMAAGFFLLLRPLAEPFEAPDVPVLTALLLPWLAYPLVAAVAGWAAGRALGMAPLLPAAVFLAFLPSLLYPHVPYGWRQGAVYAAVALAGNLLGAAWRRLRERGA